MDKFEKNAKLWLKGLFFSGMLLYFLTFSPHCYFPPPTLSSFNLQIRQPETDSPDRALSANTLPLPSGFSATSITPDIEARIRGISYPKNCSVQLDDLRYVTILHVGFDGLTHQGELIVHKEIAGSILEIFHQLFEYSYPIEQVRLIDEYGADDEASMADNNTSAFCFRSIAGTDTLSLHSYGLAIDINPLYNPYIYNEIVSPASSPYDKETGVVLSPYFMTEEDPCVRLFKSYGFVWGGDWKSPTDYQHFEYMNTAVR